MGQTNDQHAVYPSLAGRRVFLSGGANGIGRATIEAFASQKARLHFVDIDQEASRALADEIRSVHDGSIEISFDVLDVTDTSELQSSVNAFARRAGGLDVLVNNAANDERHAFDVVTPELWNKALAVNLGHHLFATQAAAPHMAASGGGSVICLGSISWINKTVGMIGYTTAKAGIHGLVRGLARELGPDNIRVNAVLPGWTRTERQVRLWLDEAAERLVRQEQCLPGWLHVDDIARFVMFLAADDSAMCTHQCYVVDGGWI